MKLAPDCHDLLVAFLLVQSLLERRSETLFQPSGLTAAKFNILNLLATRKGRLDQATLVELLLVGKSSVSIVITRMVRQGLLRREEHPKDRRQTVLVLTGKGRELWQNIDPTYRANVKSVFGSLSGKERQSFLRNLKAIHNALDDQAAPDSFDSRVFGGRPSQEEK
jgi:DNA-binding MarR family transcriptional regulator